MAARLIGRAKNIKIFGGKKEPKEAKEPLRKRLGQYLLTIFNDYKFVAKDTLDDIRNRPIKAGLIFSSLGLFTAFMRKNPDDRSFQSLLINNSHDLLLLSDLIRSDRSDDYIQSLNKAYTEGCLRRLNLGVCSLMWVADHDRAVDLYDARCKHLKPRWLTFHERVVDIGVWNRWIYLTNIMEDYDINPSEWPEESRHKTVMGAR